MKITQFTIQRTFFVQHNGKIYYVDYLNSDGHILGLLNRNNWEIYNEDSNELNIYSFKGDSKKKEKETNDNRKLFIRLVNFCIKHFDNYQPLKEKTKKGEIKLKRA